MHDKYRWQGRGCPLYSLVDHIWNVSPCATVEQKVVYMWPSFVHIHSYKWTVTAKKVAQNYEYSKESSLNIHTKA